VTVFRAFLALLLAVPAFAQVREVPPLSAPVFAARALPALSAPSIGSAFPSLPAVPILTERASFELQKDADRLYAALANVHAQEMQGAPRASLAPAKRAVAADLQAVLTQLPAAPADWSALSSALKSLRARRDALEGTGAAASRERAELNGKIYALQMHAAWAQLTGKAPLNAPAFRRNAALWSLVGAYNSAAAGRAESGWREGLDRAEAVFGDGRMVVVSRRWRNVHSELEDAARDARNGREQAAATKFAELAGILSRAPVEDASVLARHRQAASALHAAAAAALARESGASLSARALAVKDLIPHPKLAEPSAVAYDGADKAARAQFHAFQFSKKEYLAVLAREAALTRWALILSGPRPAKADREAARADLSEARAWAGRGFVGAKQVAAQNLDAALTALDRGDDALAARHAGLARDELAARRAELERIAAGLRSRLARLTGA
jgi:hypothetical protein